MAPSPDPTPAAADPWHWTPPQGSRWSRPVGLLRLDGPDTLRVLHGQTSQALEGARPGQWLGTCCISPTARLRAVAEVLVDDAGAWLVIVDGDAGAVRTALDRVLFPADKVRLGPVTAAVLHQPLGAPEPEALPAGTWVVAAGNRNARAVVDFLGGKSLMLDCLYADAAMAEAVAVAADHDQRAGMRVIDGAQLPAGRGGAAGGHRDEPGGEGQELGCHGFALLVPSHREKAGSRAVPSSSYCISRKRPSLPASQPRGSKHMK